MSDTRDTPDIDPRNSRLLLETAERANFELPLNVTSNAQRETRDNVNLNQPVGSEIRLPNSVIINREFPLELNDFSLIIRDENSARVVPTDVRHSRTANNERDRAQTIRDENTINSDKTNQNRRDMTTRTPPRDVHPENSPSESDEDTHDLINPHNRGSEGNRHVRRVAFQSADDPLLLEILHTLQELRTQTVNRDRNELTTEDRHRTTRTLEENPDYTIDRTYRESGGNRGPTGGSLPFLNLKEARNMVPEIDGTSRDRVREFLKASEYAIRHIHPADESTLLEAILCIKLKGKAMKAFENRTINTYEQLKDELETEYLSRRSTAHLQLEFNSLKQKSTESAQEFGRRVDTLAMELYDSMEEGKNHTREQQQAIMENIKDQALLNYQIGLREEINTLVRSQHYRTLQDAIAGASVEEKIKGLNDQHRAQPREKRFDSHLHPAQNSRNTTPRCGKCGKNGHYGRDCRSSRYAMRFALPKPEDRPRVNTVDKYCNYCKKPGHIRNECWALHGQPARGNNPRRGSYFNKNPRGIDKRENKPRERKAIKNSDSHSSDDEETDKTNAKPTRTVGDYRITHIKRAPLENTGLDLITLPAREAENGKISFLYDTGATISIVKLKVLRDDTAVHENKTKLIGISGHSIEAIGIVYITIQLNNGKITHPVYVIRDDVSIEYEGILGVDFIKRYTSGSDYNKRQIRIGDTKFRLRPFKRITLKPRSETIVQVTADRNITGITYPEEPTPGVFIGCCLVEPHDFTCPVSILNTTESEINIQVPHVIIEEFTNEPDETLAINTAQPSEQLEEPRKEKIKQLIRTTHLNQEERKSLLYICEEYQDVFHLEGEALTCTSIVSHEITTRADSATVNVRPYRLPEKHKKEVNKQIREMLEQEIIQPSHSQWNAPLLVVPKKTDASGKQKSRIVIDFRKLNDLTIGDSFPIPNITDILDQLGNAKYFTTLDLASGYHQIPMAEHDKKKTAFSTPHGHYEFNRMPFGLKNAPATFQRLMNNILTGMRGLKCLVYLDDIVIYGPSLEEHNKRLIKVLGRLRKNNLKLQPDKCEFLRKEVVYLGHVITENGILPDPNKLKAVSTFPVPKRVKDIQSFIGLAGYYRKFIEDFSKITKPLTKLTRKDVKFVWTTEQQDAFETLKNKLMSAPVLIYPDFTQEFVVTTDASDYAVGAVLSQGMVGQDRPIAYASRVLSRAEQNYNTTEKELLAIVWAVKHFRPYLYGTKFKIVTDHKPLIWLFNVNDPGSRLIRWRLKIEEYDYEIIHKAGKRNTNADALSRNPICNVKQEEENILTRRYSEEEKQKILYEYHNAPTGGHQGVTRTLNRIRIDHTWPGITKDVERHITKCEHCQKNKLKRIQKSPLIITETPDKPFEKCALDIVGPLTITNAGNKYILTFQDCLTKFSKAIPIANQEAATIAKEFITKIVLEHGIPDKVLTDQGTNFVSEMFKNVCRLLKIEKIQTTAYHPESNGALERTHRTLTEYLRHYINNDQTDWDEWIPYAIFTFNTTPHTATGYTPFELVYGHTANLPTALTIPPKPSYTYDDYAQELKERLRATNQLAKEHLKVKKHKAKEYQDRKAKEIKFQIGDKVLLYDETLRRGRSKKLDALWTGPYIVLERNSDVNYTIKTGRKKLLTHANRLKAYIEN